MILRRRARREAAGQAGPHSESLGAVGFGGHLSLDAVESEWMEYFTGKDRTSALVILNSRARGFSIPGVMRYHRPDPRLAPHQQKQDIVVMVHERWHQVQYRERGRIAALARLAREQLLYMRGVNVYRYEPGIRTLGDIRCLEAQAQFVEDFVHVYLDVKTGERGHAIDLERRARVLRDSGVESLAVKRVLGGGG